MKPIVDLDAGTVVIGGWVFTFTHSGFGNDWVVKAHFNGLMKATDLQDIEKITDQARSAWLKAIIQKH